MIAGSNSPAGKKRESQTIKGNRKSRFALEGRQIIDEIWKIERSFES